MHNFIYNNENVLGHVLIIFYTLFWVWLIPTRNIRSARKRLMQRCMWMVVRVLWMVRTKRKVNIQISRQVSDSESPIQVINSNSNTFCHRGDIDWWRNLKKKTITNHLKHLDLKISLRFRYTVCRCCEGMFSLLCCTV